MSDTTDTLGFGVRQVERPSIELPRPDPFALSGPVMIGDAVTPLGRGTLLWHLLRQDNPQED